MIGDPEMNGESGDRLRGSLSPDLQSIGKEEGPGHSLLPFFVPRTYLLRQWHQRSCPGPGSIASTSNPCSAASARRWPFV